MNIPNSLTLARIALMPVLIMCFERDPNLPNMIATVIVLIAALTDLVDGYIARHWNQKSILGAVLDPIADKLVVLISSLLVLMRYQDTLMLWLIMLLLSREFIVAGLREAAACQQNTQAIPVNIIGKVKTCLQMTAIIIFMLYYSAMPQWVLILGWMTLVSACVLSLLSMVQYGSHFLRTLQLGDI